eukprot:119561_1
MLLIIIICFIISIFMLAILYPFIRSLTLYWFYDILLGFIQGILSMSAETVLLIIQPTQYSGKVNGAKGLIRNWSQAFGALFISLYWDNSKNVLYFTLFWSMICGLILTLLMIRLNARYSNVNGNK